MQIERGAVGICCAKLGEAEVFADEGIADIRPAKGAYVREQAEGEAPAMRTELASLQAVVRRSSQDLAAAEKRIASLLAQMPAEQPE